MRTIHALAAVLLAASAGSACAADTVLSYRGRLLRPDTGSGVPGARNLRFKISGHLPAPGKCRADFLVLSVTDGAFSLKDAMAQGFSPAPGNRVRVCSDAKSGALSEDFRVGVGYFSGGNLVASYAWLSADPRRGGAADSVISYANIEYHVSEAKRPGRLTTPAN